MKLVTYQRELQTRVGALLNGKVVDLNRAYRAALIHEGNESELAVADARIPATMMAFLAGGKARCKLPAKPWVLFKNWSQLARRQTLKKIRALWPRFDRPCNSFSISLAHLGKLWSLANMAFYIRPARCRC